MVAAGRRPWAMKAKSGPRDNLFGLAIFRRRYPKAGACLLGGSGVLLEAFFAKPVRGVWGGSVEGA